MDKPEIRELKEDELETQLRQCYEDGCDLETALSLDEKLRPADEFVRRRIKRIISFIHESAWRPIRVLDVGCGVGVVAACVARKFKQAKVKGVDISEKIIKIARSVVNKAGVGDRATFAVGDVKSFRSMEEFDYIVCTEVLEHLLHPEEALSNIKKLCAPFTKVIFSVPQYYIGQKQKGIFYWQKDEEGKTYKHTQDKSLLDPTKPFYTYYHNLYDEEGLKRLLENNGFKVLSVKGTGFCFQRDDMPYKNWWRVAWRKIHNLTVLLANWLAYWLLRGWLEDFTHWAFHKKYARNLVVLAVSSRRREEINTRSRSEE